MSFCQQNIIETDDVKNFDDPPDHKETQKKLSKGDSVIFSVNTACNKDSDISGDKEDQDDPPPADV